MAQKNRMRGAPVELHEELDLYTEVAFVCTVDRIYLVFDVGEQEVAIESDQSRAMCLTISRPT
jgi:hypothetical protein